MNKAKVTWAVLNLSLVQEDFFIVVEEKNVLVAANIEPGRILVGSGTGRVTSAVVI